MRKAVIVLDRGQTWRVEQNGLALGHRVQADPPDRWWDGVCQARSVEDPDAGKRAFQATKSAARLQSDDSAPGSYRYRLSAIDGAEFVHDVLDMNLDSLLRDKQPRSNIPIAMPRCDVL